MKRRLPFAARVGGRIGALILLAGVFATVAIQFEGILAKNVAIADEIATTQVQIDMLHVRTQEQARAIRRLSDPRGAIPEIHEKLKLVGPREEIIYVRGLPTPTPQPESDWQPQP